MPEMAFVARWPDDAVATYYSPSLVVAEYLEAGTTYALADFVRRSREALTIASERVRVKYGVACPRAAQTLAQIESRARHFTDHPDAAVRVEAHVAAERASNDSREGNLL
jgi:uncharacterized repeat protein (TIGR04042 family)